MKISRAEMVFKIVNSVLLILLSLSVVLPFVNIISISVSSKDAILSGNTGLLPKGVNFGAYKEILTDRVFLRAMLNTLVITPVVVFLSLIINVMAAYAFSMKLFYGKTLITYIFVITMYFSGGLIPFYLLVTKFLGWRDTYYALIIPGLVSVWYIIVLRSQIEVIPASLKEAAIIDGANEFKVLFYIIIPSIKPTIAAIGMFIALGVWNRWFEVMIFISKKELWTLQYYLRAVVLEKFFLEESNIARALELQAMTPQNFQMAAIILVALPIIMVYPFVQKYFVKGMLAGSVKG